MQLVDGRRAEEVCGKEVDRVFIEAAGGVLLLEHAVTQQDDAVGDAAGLLLIVRDKDGRDAGLTLDAADLLAHLHA